MKRDNIFLKHVRKQIELKVGEREERGGERGGKRARESDKERNGNEVRQIYATQPSD